MKPLKIGIWHTSVAKDVIEDILVVLVARGYVELTGPIGERINARAIALQDAPADPPAGSGSTMTRATSMLPPYTRPKKDWP